MSKFICEKCNKIFNKKSHYRLHINKANGCIIDDENDENYDIIYNDKIVKNIIYYSFFQSCVPVCTIVMNLLTF